MFTGIVEDVGQIRAIEQKGEDSTFLIASSKIPWLQVNTGDSISVNGVCLTATQLTAEGFSADVSHETINCTNFRNLTLGQAVNLERALSLGTPLGGHLVSGHVDGVAVIQSVQQDARSIRYAIELPKNLQHYVAMKGSVCLDGVSLTVNQVQNNIFDVNIIPHTQTVTNVHNWQVGTQLNIEVDLIARYLERLMSGRATRPNDGVTMQTLKENGFIR